MSGSSPHTRGAPIQVAAVEGACGIIPAYAGSTQVAAKMRLIMPDHPRIRGEHRLASEMQVTSPGSSPHTRGARVAQSIQAIQARIIPAYAGSTPDFRRGLPEAADHPRIRGEHTGCPSTSWRWKGSSPHTRGAQDDDPGVFECARIIPAYAGSTRGSIHRENCPRDHPRIRGEHRSQQPGRADNGGSSPHTRGALSRERRFCPPRRIIPAYAGSTEAFRDRS